MYIGSSSNLKKRFINHFNIKYISSAKNNLSISRAFIKYNYNKFSLEILEYCELYELLQREQYYLDLFKPNYNIALIAGSNKGFKHSIESRAKLSSSLTLPPFHIFLKEYVRVRVER
jgi:group I intron endonuclease